MNKIISTPSIVSVGFLVIMGPAIADSCLVSNSISPDGKLAFYAVDSTEPYMPAILEVRSLNDQKRRLLLKAGGYVRLASEYDFGNEDKDSIFVLWNPSGSRVAMMVRDGKRSGSLVICERKDDLLNEKILPDFTSALQKALNFNVGGRYGYEFPVAWQGDEELSVKIRCDGVDPADTKTYDFVCSLTYQLSTGKLSNFQVLSKTLREG